MNFPLLSDQIFPHLTNGPDLLKKWEVGDPLTMYSSVNPLPESIFWEKCWKIQKIAELAWTWDIRVIWKNTNVRLFQLIIEIKRKRIHFLKNVLKNFKAF